MAHSSGITTWTIRDYDGEISTVTVHALFPTAGNFSAQSSQRSALENSLVDIMGGTIIKVQFGGLALAEFGGPPTMADQRELKWLVKYHGATTHKYYSVSIPCAKAALLNPLNRAYANLSEAAMIAFKAAFELYVRTIEGDTVLVDDIRLVGRRV